MVYKIFLVILISCAFNLVGQTTCSYFSTYFGGTQFDEIKSVCVDANKNSYIIGNTYSADLPVTPGLINNTASGDYDVFIAKFDSCGALIWSTYFGSGNFDSGEKLKLTNDGNLVFCGYTSGVNTPTTVGCFQSTNHGGYDCFITKITPNGTLIWSTYFGQSGGDFAFDIAVDAMDNILVGGTTISTNLYTTASSFQPNHKGGTDAFIARFNKNGIFKWSTYYGGNSSEDIHSLVVDNNYNIIGVGGTASTNLNTSASAYQTTNDGGNDVYVIKLDSSGSRVFSSYLGGSSVDDAWGLTTDATQHIYIGGHTKSSDFDTTAGAYQTIINGINNDWYLTKWSPTGTLLISTLFGGSGNDYLSRLTLLSPNQILLIGNAESIDAPMLGTGTQTVLGGSYDGLLVKFDCASLSPNWSSYYGGSADEDFLDITRFDSTQVWIVGSSNSTNYPLSSSPYQPILNASNDGVVTRLNLNSPLITQITETKNQNTVTVYPNPFNSFININSKNISLIKCVDVFGKELMNVNSSANTTFNTNQLASGIYFITVVTQNESQTFKLIKY